jgi:hypothetical protein
MVVRAPTAARPGVRRSLVLVSCWSVKGGSGTTVVSVSLALVLARRASEGVLLVDLAGEVPAVLGIAEPTGPGVAEWLAAGEAVPIEGWSRLEVPAPGGIAVVPRGSGPLGPRGRVEVLAELLATDGRPVVVDCGLVSSSSRVPSERHAWLGGPAADERGEGPLGDHRHLVPVDGGAEADDAAVVFAGCATHSLLVIRGCYLALRRALHAPIHPSGAVFVHEAGRPFSAHDISQVLDVPVVAEVAHDPAIGRAVDAGVLASRPPRGLERIAASAA